MTEIITTDVLVIGGGGAAARAAVEAANLGVHVTLVDKGKPGASGSSPLCLKGIHASLRVGDSPEAYYADWLNAAQGMCDHNLVWESVMGSAANIIQMTELGVDFVKDKKGLYWLYLGAGHSQLRGLTADYKRPQANLITIYAKEFKRRGGQIIEGVMITKLLKKGDDVRGAIGISAQGEVCLFKTKSVVLAGGGANRIYACIPEWIRGPKFRTTGDAFKLAFDAGAQIIDMEFPNFRETPPGASRVGGIYLNAEGERFMKRYDPVAMEKAPRQLMVAAIYTELEEGRGPIYWHIDKKLLKMDTVFADIFKNKDKVEVEIDFQRLLGGAHINERAATSVPHLFAAGESAGGLHGADRMQGNGFLDTQIFGARAGYYAAQLAQETDEVNLDQNAVKAEKAAIKKFKGDIDPNQLIKTIQKSMWTHAGVIRNANGLNTVLDVIENLKQEQIPKLSGENIFYNLEAKNILLTAEMIVRAALRREESRGSHRRKDFPRKKERLWKKHIALHNEKGEIKLTETPVRTLKDRIAV